MYDKLVKSWKISKAIKIERVSKIELECLLLLLLFFAKNCHS